MQKVVLLILIVVSSIALAQETIYLTNNNFTNRTYLITNFSFRGITLGMIKSNVEKIIEDDEFLEIDESSYLGLFDKEKPFVLKAVALPYIKSIYFVFENDILFNIIVNYNPTIYSYSELLKGAKRNYDQPTDEFPDYSIWQFSPYELRVEKPATVKFFLTSTITNVTIKSYESSRRIKERSEYSKRELFPFK